MLRCSLRNSTQLVRGVRINQSWQVSNYIKIPLSAASPRPAPSPRSLMLLAPSPRSLVLLAARSSQNLLVIVSASLSSLAVAVGLIAVCFVVIRRRNAVQNLVSAGTTLVARTPMNVPCRRLEEIAGTQLVPRTPMDYPYEHLEEATKSFSDVLGRGAFGKVYKGVLDHAGSPLQVAVKRLEGVQQGAEDQFQAEIFLLGTIHHIHLVRLYGYCVEGPHKLLVYEFMENGSLAKWLFPSSAGSRPVLPWQKRYEIALQSARGIEYLHTGCRPLIIHCDIKPENILLDGGWSAEVSDFGLAKLMSTESQREMLITGARGTFGYMAPEWRRFSSNRNLITPKADVYSFGIVLLEIIQGCRNCKFSSSNISRFLCSTWESDQHKACTLNVLDGRLDRQHVDIPQACFLLDIAFRCIVEDPHNRPSMATVVRKLEESLHLPMDTNTAIGGGSTLNGH